MSKAANPLGAVETAFRWHRVGTTRHNLKRYDGKLCRREYAAGEVILPRCTHVRLQAHVSRGRVSIISVGQGRRQVVGQVSRNNDLNREMWTRYQVPFELRAAEKTTLYISYIEFITPEGHPVPQALPCDHVANDFHSLSLTPDSVAPAPKQLSRRLRREFLLVLLPLLLVALVWPLESPLRPLLSDLTYGLASSALHRGHQAEASTLLQVSLALHAGAAWAHNDLGTIYYNSGRLPEAQEAFHRALAADPTLAVALNNLGLVLLDQGQWQQAKDVLEEAVALDPESAAAWANLGLAERMTGDPRQAMRSYRAALRLDGDNLTVQANLAGLCYQELQLAEAKEYLATVVEEMPEVAPAHLLIGAIALAEGERTVAWHQFEVAEEAMADEPLLYFYRGLWYEGVGRWPEMEQEMKQVLALRPHGDLAALARSHLVAHDLAVKEAPAEGGEK